MAPPLELKGIKLQPLVLGSRTVHHVQTLSPKLQSIYTANMFLELDRLPEDLFCGAPENEERKREKLAGLVETGEITQEEADTLLADFQAGQGTRMSLDYMNGEIYPINWAARLVDRELDLGFQMYGIKILSRVGNDFSLGCHIWPMYLHRPRPSWGSVIYQQIIAQATRVLLNNIIRSDDNQIRARVDVVDPLPYTSNININLKSQEIEAGVKAIIQTYPDVAITTVTRFGRNYDIYTRI